MITKLNHVTIWVRDQEEAKRFYVETLGFKVKTDDRATVPGYRWLTVMPAHQKELEIVLGLATEAEQIDKIGKQGTWVLSSDNLQKDYENLKARGVKMRSGPRQNPWGMDFVLEDLYGNTFDVVQEPLPGRGGLVKGGNKMR